MSPFDTFVVSRGEARLKGARPNFFRIAEKDSSPSILAMEKLLGSNLSEFNLSVLEHWELIQTN